MKITAIAPWFGSKRTLAPEIVRQLGPHSYYFEGCFGSLAVLFAKEVSEHETVCDLHGGVTNLAWTVQNDQTAPVLFDRLQRVPYHDDIYAASKEWLKEFEDECCTFPVSRVDYAYHYFIASWMGRNGVAGTARYNYQIATRWTPNGGSGPLRFRNAVESIPAWWDRLRNVHILRRDVFKVLEKIEDDRHVAIYIDPPYLHGTISGNSRYLCDFKEGDAERLAETLGRFRKSRVVVSYYADEQLQKLYPGWTVLDCSRHKHLHTQNKRGSKRTEAPEVLLINGEPAKTQPTSMFA
jgi:DNA adenine methylase